MKRLLALLAATVLSSCGTSLGTIDIANLPGAFSIEAEATTTDGSTINDAAASGGKSVNLWVQDKSLSIELPSAGAYDMVLRAKGSFYKVWPKLKFSDGQEIELSSGTYKDFRINAVHVGSDKKISATYINDEYGGTGMDRNAFVDVVTLVLRDQNTTPIPAPPVSVPNPVTPAPVTPVPVTPNPTTTSSKERLRKANGFAVRYAAYGTDRVSSIANDPCDVVVISPVINTNTTPFTTWSKAELQEIKRRSPNKIILAYINIGHTHKQSVVTQKLQAAYGQNFERFPNLGYNSMWGNYIADTHAAFWQAYKKEEIDTLMTLGFDGVFYDDAWQQSVTNWGTDPQSTLPGGNGVLQVMKWAKDKYPNIINMANPGGHYAASTFFPDGIQNTGSWVGQGAGKLASDVLDAVYFESISYATGGTASSVDRRNYLINNVWPLVKKSGVLDYWCDYTANDETRKSSALNYAKSVGIPLSRYRLDNGGLLNIVVGNLL